MSFWKRKPPAPPPEDNRTAEVAARLEAVAARMESFAELLERRLAEQGGDYGRSIPGPH